jgi:YD repeat-containing protein
VAYLNAVVPPFPACFTLASIRLRFANVAIIPFLVVTSLTLLAQTSITYTPQMPTHGVGHDYIGMLDETVNPADGNVNISIKFPVPQGRSLTVPFSLVYSSSTLGAMNGHFNGDFLAANGWSYTFPILSYVQGEIQIGTVNEENGNNEPQYCYYSSNYAFHAPGTGSQHQLVLSQTYGYGVPYNGATCSTVPALVGGDYEYLASLSNNSGCEGAPCVTQGATVADADGTIYYFSGALDWGGGATGELLAMPTYIEDRNGNRATIQNNYSSCCGPYTGGASIVDDAGRTALSTTGFGQTGNTISVSGISNPYTLTWGQSSQEILIPVEEYGQAAVGGLGPCPQVGQNGWGAQPSLGPGITTLTLPNEQNYTFSYDPTYGLLSQITYPSGGYVKYTWGLNQNSSSFVKTLTQYDELYYCVWTVDQPAVVQRQVSYDGKTVALTQTFQYSTTWQSPQVGWIQSETTTVTTTDNISGLSYATVYTYSATSSGQPPNDPAPQPSGWQLEYPSEEQQIVYYGTTSTSGTPLKTVTKGWYDPDHLICEVDTLDNGQFAGVFNAYGSGGSGGPGFIPLLLQKNEYDYGQLSSASACKNGASIPSNVPTRETAITYHPFGAQPLYFQPVSTMTALTLADRPASVMTYGNIGGTLTKVAETDYSYDQTSVSAVSGATGHDETNYSSSSTAPRGNGTTKVVQCLQGCGVTTTTYTYNELGQVTSMTDPCGNATCPDVSGTSHTTSYTYYGSNSSYAFLDDIYDPLNHFTAFGFDFTSSQLSSVEDSNGAITGYSYNDPFARLTQVTYQDGGNVNYSYNDSPYNSTSSPPTPNVTTTKAITSSLNAVNIVAADGMGHPWQTQFTSDPDGTDYTKMTYDGLGRKYTVTNPYRTTSDSTYGTTGYTYDALGRVISVAETDGSKVQTSYCGPNTWAWAPSRSGRTELLDRERYRLSAERRSDCCYDVFLRRSKQSHGRLARRITSKNVRVRFAFSVACFLQSRKLFGHGYDNGRERLRDRNDYDQLEWVHQRLQRQQTHDRRGRRWNWKSMHCLYHRRRDCFGTGQRSGFYH